MNPHDASSPAALSAAEPGDGARESSPRLVGRPSEATWSDEELAFARNAVVLERERREAARIRPEDSGLDILERVFDHRADATPLLEDAKAFAAHVREAEGPATRVEATAGESPTKVDDAALGAARVLEFGPGTYRLDARRWSHVHKDLSSVELRGAGRDATTLVLDNDLLVLMADLSHLRVRDVTIDGGERGDSALDVRGRVAAVFERVRFRSWWPHAGHGAAIGVSGRAYVALLACIVEGGVGKPTGGFALSLRGPALVVAQECAFCDLDAVVIGTTDGSGGRVRLERCTYLNAPLADGRITSGQDARPYLDVRAVGGGVAYLSAEVPDAQRSERWGARYAAEVRDVAFGPDDGLPTLGTLLAVLDAFPVDAGSRIAEIHVEASARGDRPGAFAIFTVDSRSRTTRWRVEGTGRGTVPRRNDVGGGTALPPLESIERALDLADALRRSGLPSNAGASRVLYGIPRARDEAAVIHVLDAEQGLLARLDGHDGQVIKPGR